MSVSGVEGMKMSKPVIFTSSAAWDQEASVWTGHCDDIPAAADAPTLDGLLEKISAMALDLLPDNHPDVAPESYSFRSLHCVRPNWRWVEWRRSLIARYGIYCAPPVVVWFGLGAAATKSGTARLRR